MQLPGIPLVGMCIKELKAGTQTCISALTVRAPSFTDAERCEQPVPRDRWMDGQMKCACNRIYADLKRKRMLVHSITLNHEL